VLILSDMCIHKAMKRSTNALIVDPPLPREALQPASLDITLGDSFDGWQILPPNSGWYIPMSRRAFQLDAGMDIALLPGAFMLGTTEQTFTIPEDLCAHLSGKSSLARLGLQVHATAGWIDPGFHGQITLEMSNLSSVPITLKPGMYIAQLVFMQMCCPPMLTYGDPDLGSHYQGQTGATRSHLEASN
jgi:dCTP deaminase